MTTLIIRTAAAAAVIATSAASLLALAATPAAAHEATYEYPQPTVVLKTRADVKAELAEARANGELFAAEAGYWFVDVRPARRAAAPAVADAPKAKAAERVRAELNTSNFEPQSFDGVVTAAGGAISAVRVN